MMGGEGTKVARERGIALLMVLWTLLLLALLAAIFGTNTRTEVNLARNLVENAQAEALADAGVYRAITGLSMEPGEGGFGGDGRIYTWHASGGEVRFAIRDEGGKVDLNQAPDILLRELFVAVGVDPERGEQLAQAIADFRDEDSDKRPNGAEERDYASAGLAYGPKNQPFELVDELTYVLGVTPELYRRVAPLLTVRAQESNPHAYTAPAEVRAAMIAARASRVRSGRGSGAGRSRSSRDRGSTADDPTTADDRQESGGAEQLTLRSGVPIFTIHAEGRIPSGAVFAREAMIDFTGGENLPFVVRSWRRAERVLFPLEPADTVVR